MALCFNLLHNEQRSVGFKYFAILLERENHDEKIILFQHRIGMACRLLELATHPADHHIGEWGSKQPASGCASVLLPKCKQPIQWLAADVFFDEHATGGKHCGHESLLRSWQLKELRLCQCGPVLPQPWTIGRVN